MREGEVQIVLIDDDKVDVEAVRRALTRRRIGNPVMVFRDGLEALEGLRRTDPGAPVRKPYLILLDLNMPRMGGLEFLGELRKDERLRESVVFVLTTSSSDRDKLGSYALNVAGYMVKSNVGDDFVNMIELLGWYWRIVELPGGAS